MMLRRPLAWTGIVVLLLALGGCLPPKSVDAFERGAPQGDADVSPEAGQSCTVPAPADASEAALAYLAAVDAANPGWEQVDAMIRAAGGLVDHDVLTTQVDADRLFLDGLRAIQWPSDAARTAADLITVVDAYDQMLMTGYAQDGYLDEHRDEVAQINETRAETSHRLRDILGLEQNPCILWRP